MAVSHRLSPHTKGFPRNTKALSLADFDASPHRAITDAAGADIGTVIYTTGRNEGEEKLGFVPLAVIIPVAEYRRLAAVSQGANSE